LAGNAASAGEPEWNGEEEVRGWEVAARLFEDAAYDLAEQDILAFTQKYPQSVRLPEAFLLLAESRYRQGKIEGALDVLQAHGEAAGGWEDRYRFWEGECFSRLGQFDEAVEAYAAMLGDHPESPLCLDALLGQAFALRQSGKVSEAFSLLSQPDGLFLKLSVGQEDTESVALGYLLIGETALGSGQAAAGLALLERLLPDHLSGVSAWQREHLAARLRAALGQMEAAAATAEALVKELSEQTNSAAVQFRADAIALAGQIYSQQNDTETAVAMFERNLERGVIEERRREAASELARLALRGEGVESASARLEAWLARYGEDAELHPLRVALAEVGLRRFFALPAERRVEELGSLQQVRQRIGPALTNAVAPWGARAQFALGWCAWEEAQRAGDRNRFEEGARAFESAAEELPRSAEQAVAWFKAGDARYALAEYSRAIEHYWVAATNFADLSEVQQGFGDRALYQIVRAAGELKDMQMAERAMELVLELHPQGPFGDRSLLVYGQVLSEAGRPVEARQLFTDFLQRFPSSGLAPDLGLSVARTWQQEGNWAEASAEYERWILAHDADHPSRGQAAYELAWSAHRAGDEARAFERFNDFLAEFPLHSLAPSALNWVADYHFRQGRYDLAESEYQRIYQNTNWPASDLKLHSRMMAGRSAFRRTSYREARGYFTELINRVAGTNAPAGLLPEAYFALGDAIRHGSDADKVLASLAEAIVAYSKIPQSHPESSLVPLAWGEIGNCHFQLAKADANQYDLAIAAYTNVVDSMAPVAVRSQAEVGIAMCLEAQAALPGVTNRTGLQIEALERYLRVTEGGNLEAGEEAELFWVERAGAAGALLAEQLQRWEVAENLYARLMDLIPSLRSKYEIRRDRVRQARASAG
jgi:TolA-binding protein